MGKREGERVRVSVVGCEGTPDRPACRRDQIRQTEEKEEAPLATRMMPTDITEMKLWQLEGMESAESVNAQFWVCATL